MYGRKASIPEYRTLDPKGTCAIVWLSNFRESAHTLRASVSPSVKPAMEHSEYAIQSTGFKLQTYLYM